MLCSQIALFSAVLTAFIVPATQNLFPNSNNDSSDPTGSLPPSTACTSTERVHALLLSAHHCGVSCQHLHLAAES